jgi:hypothetical protein
MPDNNCSIALLSSRKINTKRINPEESTREKIDENL